MMTGDAGNVGYFSGSVVVDKRNTAGFGVNAQVAVYTLFDKLTKRQAQGISSFSSDGHQFHFFPGNPVLDIGSTEFRDPTVFWHAPTSTWIMVVALARDRKIQFYSLTGSESVDNAESTSARPAWDAKSGSARTSLNCPWTAIRPERSGFWWSRWTGPTKSTLLGISTE